MPTQRQLFRRVGLLYVAIASEPEFEPRASKLNPKAKRVRRTLQPKECAWCGETFRPRQGRQVCCSKPCSQRRGYWPPEMAPRLRRSIDNSSTHRVV